VKPVEIRRRDFERRVSRLRPRTPKRPKDGKRQTAQTVRKGVFRSIKRGIRFPAWTHWHPISGVIGSSVPLLARHPPIRPTSPIGSSGHSNVCSLAAPSECQTGDARSPIASSTSSSRAGRPALTRSSSTRAANQGRRVNLPAIALAANLNNEDDEGLNWSLPHNATDPSVRVERGVVGVGTVRFSSRFPISPTSAAPSNGTGTP
jgi:hypothetical protein